MGSTYAAIGPQAQPPCAVHALRACGSAPIPFRLGRKGEPSQHSLYVIVFDQVIRETRRAGTETSAESSNVFAY